MRPATPGSATPRHRNVQRRRTDAPSYYGPRDPLSVPTISQQGARTSVLAAGTQVQPRVETSPQRFNPEEQDGASFSSDDPPSLTSFELAIQRDAGLGVTEEEDFELFASSSHDASLSGPIEFSHPSPSGSWPIRLPNGDTWGAGANRPFTPVAAAWSIPDVPLRPSTLTPAIVSNIVEHLCFIRTDITPPMVQDYCDSILKVADGFLGVPEAHAAAVSYFDKLGTKDIPWELVKQHTKDFYEAGSLEALAERRHAAHAHSRLSVERIDLVFTEALHLLTLAGAGDDVIDRSKLSSWPTAESFAEDIARMKYIATEGIPVIVDPKFTPSPNRGSLPPARAMANLPVNALTHSNSVTANGVILDAKATELLGVRLNVQNHGWTSKFGKAEGRLTSNCSGVADRSRPPKTPLNSPFVHLDAVDRWGSIKSPTLRDVCAATKKACDKFGRDDTVLGKIDVKAFYQQGRFAFAAVVLMAFAIHSADPRVHGSTYFSLTGNFGHTATPNIFEAYVSDHAAIVWILTSLFGPGAHNAAKDECSDTHPSGQQRMVMIGWEISLSTYRVDMAPKNRDKTLFFFLTSDPDAGLSTRQRERLVSLASRYCDVYPHLRAIHSMLCQILGGRDHFDPHVRRPVSSPYARMAVRIWRVYLMMSYHDHHIGAPTGRSIDLFCSVTPSITMEFDGSIRGAGYRIFAPGPAIPKCIVSGYADATAAHFPDDWTHRQLTGAQNTMELSALTMAVVHAALIGYRSCGIATIGDSNTILNWASKASYRSTTAVPVVMLLVAVCERFRLHICEDYVQLRSEDNKVCDALSRNRPEEAQAAGDCGPAAPINYGCSSTCPNDIMSQAFALCALRSPLETDRQFFALWGRIAALLDTIAATAPDGP